MVSPQYRSLTKEVKRLGRIYLNYASRPSGDYTVRQLSMAAAYTLFCHAEFETYFEQWSSRITDYAETKWAGNVGSKPLVHLCTFYDARGEVSAVPNKDVWSEPIVMAIKRQRGVVSANHGIKEANICRLLAPLGYDVRTIDTVLIADLTAFGKLRGDYAHGSHNNLAQNTFDPFAIKLKAEGLVTAIATLDQALEQYIS